jgi:hypothetical protein
VDAFRLIVVGLLVLILGSLARALYFMTAGKGDRGQMVRALTWRIGLSVGLLLLMLFAASRGWITPHGVGR